MLIKGAPGGHCWCYPGTLSSLWSYCSSVHLKSRPPQIKSTCAPIFSSSYRSLILQSDTSVPWFQHSSWTDSVSYIWAWHCISYFHWPNWEVKDGYVTSNLIGPHKPVDTLQWPQFVLEIQLSPPTLIIDLWGPVCPPALIHTIKPKTTCPNGLICG